MQRAKNQKNKFFGIECCVMEVKEFKSVHGNIKKIDFKNVRFFEINKRFFEVL